MSLVRDTAPAHPAVTATRPQDVTRRSATSPRQATARWSARLTLLAVIMVDAVAIAGLHGLSRFSWASVDWLESHTWTSTPPDVVVTALVRMLALGAAYWVAATMVVAVATLHRRPVRSRHWATLPVIRRLVDRALAASIATSTVLAPAVATATELPPIPVVVEVATESDADGPIPIHVDVVEPAPMAVAEGPAAAAPGDQLPVPRPAPERPVPPAVSSPETRRTAVAAVSHTVQPGESMWTIAHDHLESLGAPAGDCDVAEYWVEVMDANRATIRSGDPDLIYPGETLTLPEVRQ